MTSQESIFTYKINSPLEDEFYTLLFNWKILLFLILILIILFILYNKKIKIYLFLLKTQFIQNIYKNKKIGKIFLLSIFPFNIDLVNFCFELVDNAKSPILGCLSSLFYGMVSIVIWELNTLEEVTVNLNLIDYHIQFIEVVSLLLMP